MKPCHGSVCAVGARQILKFRMFISNYKRRSRATINESPTFSLCSNARVGVLLLLK